MAWTLRRIALSAFILVHLAALVAWNLPKSSLRERIGEWPIYYMMPTGQWQSWEMFAPNPFRETIVLESIVLDAHGRYYQYAFPRAADKGPFESLLASRHAKFPTVLANESSVSHREFAARDVLRQLDLPADAYPADVELYLKCWPSPNPGETADPMVAPLRVTLQTYRFPSIEEVQP